MSEWWTYRLTSFLLFSPSTYYRMLERYNLAIWPAQVAGMARGLAIVGLLLGKGGHRERFIAGLLAACWLWIALAFHYQRYAQINWAATWFAVAFACEALLLVVAGVLAGRLVLQPPRSGTLWIATSIVAISILGYPVLAPLTGRPWTTAEVFGVAADPTAIATVAVLALVRGRIRWLLLVVLVRGRGGNAVGDGCRGGPGRARGWPAGAVAGAAGNPLPENEHRALDRLVHFKNTPYCGPIVMETGSLSPLVIKSRTRVPSRFAPWILSVPASVQTILPLRTSNAIAVGWLRPVTRSWTLVPSRLAR